MKALHWNRRLWTTLATDCANPENRLPAPLKANIISLSIWVDKHTSQVMQQQAAIQPLIDINRIIMQGLSGQMSGAGQAAEGGPAPLAQSA
jgi:flagellar protein FlaF